MGRRDAKRKAGKREPNGRISRAKAALPSVIAALNEAERQQMIAEMSVVLAQPHRRGSTDQRCSSALGRFVLAHGLRSEVYDAGMEYMLLINRWRAAKGIPTPIRLGIGGCGEGPSTATVRSWELQIAKIELGVGQVSYSGFIAMRRLILDDQEIESIFWKDVIQCLGALAQAMCRLPSGGHPFVSAAQMAVHA